MKKQNFKFPSKRVVNSIIDKWIDEHSESWDFESDKSTMVNALKSYAKKIIKLNNLNAKPEFPVLVNDEDEYSELYND